MRNIFTRGRGGSDVDSGPVSPRDGPQRLGGIRASLAEINWPYGLHQGQGHRSEVSLVSFSKSLPVGQSLKHKKSESVVRPQQNPEGIAAWNPPPLFQAYPQAVKHAHLPACTVSADVVLRLHTHKSSGSLAGLLSPSAPEAPEDITSEKPKRRHRRNNSGSASRFEWTSKVYVLVTSGYLLQYAGEGPFNRLPERVLQLGKDSAAFASDAIPGRHWVIQVSSVAEPDRSPSSHSSLRSRLPFRGQERRHSSTFLMVFESAVEMDGWITTLRREIEALGGRKVLSETGTPKVGGQDAQPRSQASQRTLIVKDRDRFSRVMTPDNTGDQSLAISSPDIHLDPTHDDLNRDQSFDDNSTASFISHEGRQLDALRDSTNRLSFMSSGQRTMVTSPGSSPACSPIRDSFGEFDPMPELPEIEGQPQPRLRPNAMAIIDRRQSLQAINHVFDMRVASAQALRPVSKYSGARQLEAAPSFTTTQQPTPNFSIPQNQGKRHSFTRTSLGMPPTQVTTTSPLLGRMSARRPPPSALSINPRPLSLVEDQPSPALSSLSRAGTATERTGSPLSAVPSTPPVSSTRPQRAESKMAGREIRDESMRDSGISTHENNADSLLHMDRPSSELLDDDMAGHDVNRSPMLPPPDALNVPRSSTSLGVYGEFDSGNQAAGKLAIRVRRQSFTSPRQIERGRALSPSSLRSDLTQRPETPSSKSVPRSSHLRLEPASEMLLQRRSLSQLAAEGPPPAPPPNRALPPIPQKARVNVIPPPGFI